MFWFRHEHVQWLSPQIPQMRLVMKCASRGSLPFMKMLYPRKMEEVLKHSATCLLSKSILVKIPKLPTMRVIGSQFISTRFRPFVGVTAPGCKVVAIDFVLLTLVGPRPVAGSELEAAMTPLRLFVNCRVGEPAQGA